MAVPKLRFPGYTSSWEPAFLSELMTFNNGINAGKESYGQGRKFINVLDILNNNYITYNDIIGSVSVPKNVELNNKVEYGDLVFLRSSETREDVGKSSVYLDSNNFALFGGFVIRGKKTGQYNPYFLKLLLESSNVRNQISSKAGGSTRFNVSQSILSSVEIVLPNEREQSQIAQFFLNLDKKIKLQQEKIDLLKEQKKGFMQKIFTQKLRFKDENGQEFPKWVHLNAEKILSKTTDEKVLADEIDPKKLLTVKLHRQGVAVNTNNSTLKIGSTTYYKREAGDFIYGKQNFFNGAFGIIPDNLNNYLSSGDVPTLKFNKRIINPVFFLEYIGRYGFYKKCENLASGTGSKRIHESTLLSIDLTIPSIEEQNIIVFFVKNIDTKIDLEEKKMVQMIEQKNAFMQRMFV